MKNLLTTSLLVYSLVVAGQSFKVMTYNIRYDNPSDGVNAWPNRKDKLFNLLKIYDADIIGIQEALSHQVTDITAFFSDYTYVGVGRDDGVERGEYAAIIFKKIRFEVLDQNTFWLSEFPQQPGSKSWDAAITRVATWALLKEKTSGRKFLVVNTHFDHVGKEARRQSAELLKQKITELARDVPAVITGDFNFTREEEPYQIMTDGALVELIDPAPVPAGTFCSFDVNSIECKAIDYIFLTNEWRADSYKVIADNNGKYYPSDHLPVMVTLSFTD